MWQELPLISYFCLDGKAILAYGLMMYLCLSSTLGLPLRLRLEFALQSGHTIFSHILLSSWPQPYFWWLLFSDICQVVTINVFWLLLFSTVLLIEFFHHFSGNCSFISNKEHCVSAEQGKECVWVDTVGCMALGELFGLGLKLEDNNVTHGNCNPAEGTFTYVEFLIIFNIRKCWVEATFLVQTERLPSVNLLKIMVCLFSYCQKLQYSSKIFITLKCKYEDITYFRAPFQ